MRKRKLLAWILTVVMLFTVLGAFPMTATADSVDSTDAFSITVDETTTLYSSLIAAVNAVPDGGTIKVLKNISYSCPNANDATGILNFSGSMKTYTIDGKINETTNAEINVTTTYGLDFTNSNVTLLNLSIKSTAANTTAIRVAAGSTVTIKDSVVDVVKGTYGAIAMYGDLVIDNSTVHETTDANSQFIHAQNRTWGGATGVNEVTLTLKPGANLVEDGGKNLLNSFGMVNIVVYPNVTCTAGILTTAKSVTVKDADGNDYTGDLSTNAAYRVAAKLKGIAVYENDAAAVAAGYNFRIGTEGNGNYYSNLISAVIAVEEGGTIQILNDFSYSCANANNAESILNFAYTNAGTNNVKTYTIDGKISESKNAVITVTSNYGLDFARSNVTLQNVTLQSTRAEATTPLRVMMGSTVTVKDSTVSAKKSLYGVIANYGSLVIDNSTISSESFQNNGMIHTQTRSDFGNPPATSSTLYITLKPGAKLLAGAGDALVRNDPSHTSLTAYPNVTSTAAKVTVGTFTIKNADDTTYTGNVEDLDPAQFAFVRAYYGISSTVLAKIGTKEYYNMATAISEVAEGGTITLVADLTAGIVANNNKSFTIDGGGHTVAVNGNPALTVNAGTTVTAVNVTFQSTTARNAVDLAGGALTLGNGAVVKSIYTNASGNSQGNGVRATATGASLNVLPGATIQAGGGAIVFDGFTGTGTVNISGGTITSDYYLMPFTACVMDVTISGGDLTCTATTTANNAGAFRYYNSTHSLVITGGTIKFANKTNLFSNASTLEGIKTPDWVRILGGKIEKTTAGEEATLDVDSLKSAVAGLSVTSGAAQLRIPVQASFGNSGIAFATTVDKATYDALVATYGAAAVKTGTLILPTANVPAELTYDNVVGLGTGKFLDVANSGFYNEETAETDGNYLWYGSIVNLKAKNTNRDFTGVGYIGVTTSVASIGSVTVAVCGAGTVANARTLATAAEEGNAAQNDLLNFFKTGEMPF